MEACYKETTKYIKIYIPTGEPAIGGTRIRKIIINKENNSIVQTEAFIRKDQEEKFLERISKEALGDEIYPIYAKALLQTE